MHVQNIRIYIKGDDDKASPSAHKQVYHDLA